jgi:hypothetical protein
MFIVTYTIDGQGKVYAIETIKWFIDHNTWQSMIVDVYDLINVVNPDFKLDLYDRIVKYEETLKTTEQEDEE